MAPWFFRVSEPSDRTPPRDPLYRPKPLTAQLRLVLKRLRPYKGG